MMNKLELAHLAPYLPYKLTGYCFWKNKNSGLEYERTGELVEVKAVYNRDEVNPLVVKSKSFPDSNLYSILAYDYETFRPCLRPMSELTDAYIDNLNLDLLVQMDLWDLRDKRRSYWSLSYSTAITLFENHFDVFGLIDQGLAVRYKDAGHE